MKALTYSTGEVIMQGDRIRYCGDEGAVDFVVVEKTGDGRDWYVEQCDGESCCMVTTEKFGSVLVCASEVVSDLSFVARSNDSSAR